MFSFTVPKKEINIKLIFSLISILLSFTHILASVTNEQSLFINKSGSVWVEAAAITTTITASSNSVCKNATSPIVVIEAKSGTAPYTFVYKINDGTEITKTTTGSNDTINIKVNTSTVGTFKYILVSVASKDGVPEAQTGKELTVTVNEPPTVDFSFNDNQCSGSSVAFTPTVTGASPFKYEWTFGSEGTANTEKPSKVFNSYGCGTATYAIKLVVTDKNGCSSTKTKSLTIKQQPSTNFIDIDNPYNPDTYFNNCSNASSSNSTYTINVGNQSISTSCIDSYNISWGDGSTASNVSFPIGHTYSQIGTYNLIITAKAKNGCDISKKFTVKNISNPSGGIINPGNTQNLCATTENLNFTISKWGANSPGTTYNIIYDDGTSITLKQDSLVTTQYYNNTTPSESENYPIPHKYKDSNCPRSQYTVTLTVTNACGATTGTTSNITVLSKPKASLKVTGKACVNTPVIFDNTTTSGYGVGCTQSGYYSWDFGDGITILNQLSYYPADQTHTYSKTGNYTVIMQTKNVCDTSKAEIDICVDTIPNTSFMLDKKTGCLPLTVISNNTTKETTICNTKVKYKWEVVYSAGFCGTASSYTITDTTKTITNGISTSKNTTLVFNNSGTYIVKLSATNDCGTKTVTDTVRVKAPPTISINTINPICEVTGGTTINPTATVTNCGSGNLAYIWKFPGGTPNISTSLIPGAIKYNTSGTHKFSLEVINECDTTKAESSFTINPMPVITGNLQACVGKTEKLSGNGTPAITTPWVSSNTAVATISSTGNVVALIAGTTNITYTNSSGCKALVAFTVIANPTITGTSNVCVGDTRKLTGSGTPATSNPWASLNTSIATVNDTGLVKGAGVGTTTITYTNSTGCQTVSTFTVNALPVISGNLNGCIGASTQLTGTGSPFAASPWTSSDNNIAVITNSGLVTGKALGTTIITYINSNGCQDTAKFTVNEPPTIDKPGIQIVCNGTKTLEINFSGNLTNATYKWTVDKTGIGISSSGTGSIPSFTAINTSTSSIIATFTVTPSANGCDGNAQQFTITIQPSPVINHPQPVSVCINGESPILSVSYLNSLETPEYQWYSNTINDNTTGTLISGENKSSYSAPANTIGTIYYYCILNFKNGGGCGIISSNTAAVTVNPIPAIVSEPLKSQTICKGGFIVPLKAETTGGAGTPTYKWFGNTTNSNTGGTEVASSEIYTPPAFNTIGNFYFYVEISFSGNGCGKITSQTTEVIVVADPVVDSQPLNEQTICKTTSPTTLTVNVSGGTGTFKYQWYRNSTNSYINSSPITTAQNSSFIPPTDVSGTTYYYCEITQSASGCSVLSDISKVTVVEGPSITTQPKNATYCKDDVSGKLTVTFKNGEGIPVYQWYESTTNSPYVWNVVGANSSEFLPTTAVSGTKYYKCILTFSSGGCGVIESEVASITVNPYPVIADIVLMIGSGQKFEVLPETITTNVVPTGTTYTWKIPTIIPLGSVTGASAQLTPINSISQVLTNNTNNLAVVRYIVSPVTGNCKGTDFTITVNVNPPLDPGITLNHITCFGADNGSIQTNITGGAQFTTGAPYLINWTGPDGFISSSASITNLKPGTYILTIKDANNVTYINNYTIIEPDDIVITTDEKNNVSCNGIANGSISVTVKGGTGKYIYNWQKNSIFYSSAEDLENLDIGEYKLTIYDTNNCGPKTVSYSIIQPESLQINLTEKTDNICFGDSVGGIKVSVTGGSLFEVSPGKFDYKYSWRSNKGFTSTSKDIENLHAGEYTLLVTDKSGCTTEFKTTVGQPAEIMIDTIITPISCYGADDASIKLNVSGGNSPYSADWITIKETGFFKQNLSANDYVIIVTDASGCQKQITVKIPEAPLFKITPKVKQISCNGAKDGSIKLKIEGGYGKIKIKWEDDPTIGTERNNIGPGNYNVRISDEKPCFHTFSFKIIEPEKLFVSGKITDALDCENTMSGAIDITVNGGTPPYKYFWNPINSTSQDLTGIQSGKYHVTVTDSIGCSIDSIFEVKRPSPIKIEMDTKQNFDCQNQYLSTFNTAKVTGGVPPYAIQWSDGKISGNENEIMETDKAGIVVVKVTDSMGCSNSYSFRTEKPTAGIHYEAYDCMNQIYSFDFLTSGSIFTNASYIWDFGDGSSSSQKNPLHTYLKPGEYTVKATIKSVECNTVFEKRIEVDSIPVLMLNREVKLCKFDSITVKVSGAYSYLWNDGSKADSLVIKTAGDYYVVGTSKNGCTVTHPFTASYYESYNYKIYTDKNYVTPELPDMKFWSEDIYLSKYFWDFGDETSDSGNNITHNYFVNGDGYYNVILKVLNPDGCTETTTKKVYYSIDRIPNIFTPNGDGNNDVFLKGSNIQIYNSNGILLYEGINGWDGTYKGKPVASDTYYYVKVTFKEKGTESISGYVTVVR